MINIATTEWLKIRNYRAFWWMIAIIILSYPGINYLFHFVYRDISGRQDNAGAMVRMLDNPFTFPDVWQSVAYFSSWFIFIPALIIIMFITNEYTYKTHRQNIIDGWSRGQFMTGKLIDVLLISILITVVYILVALVIGYINSSSGSDISAWKGSRYILYFGLQTFSQLSLAFLVAFLVRKAFIALGIFFFYFIIFEPAIVGISRRKFHDIGRFLPMEISDRLTPFPKFLSPLDEDFYNKLVSSINTHLLYTLILLAITWGICFLVNKRRDL